MSIVRPASASRLVIPMSAAVFAVGAAGMARARRLAWGQISEALPHSAGAPLLPDVQRAFRFRRDSERGQRRFSPAAPSEPVPPVHQLPPPRRQRDDDAEA